MRMSTILGTSAALLAAAAPALATHDGIHPTFRTEQTYFHCSGTTKVANVSLLEDAVPTWDTTKPTQSVQSGAGCGWAGSGRNRGTYMENIYDATFKGAFTGNLDDITVQLHNIYAGQARTGTELTVQVRLTVDGKSVFGTDRITNIDGDPEDVPTTKTLALKPVTSSSGVSGLVEFSITDIGYDTEDGDGEIEHEVQLTIDTTEPLNAWVYDTTEVPSGLLFNPPAPAAKTLVATTPGPAVVEGEESER